MKAIDLLRIYSGDACVVNSGDTEDTIKFIKCACHSSYEVEIKSDLSDGIDLLNAEVIDFNVFFNELRIHVKE